MTLKKGTKMTLEIISAVVGGLADFMMHCVVFTACVIYISKNI
jgi:hypothetical protein